LPAYSGRGLRLSAGARSQRPEDRPQVSPTDPCPRGRSLRGVSLHTPCAGFSKAGARYRVPGIEHWLSGTWDLVPGTGAGPTPRAEHRAPKTEPAYWKTRTPGLHEGMPLGHLPVTGMPTFRVTSEGRLVNRVAPPPGFYKGHPLAPTRSGDRSSAHLAPGPDVPEQGFTIGLRAVKVHRGPLEDVGRYLTGRS
jgi:hypothetical protein